jgi:hypothetical protein
MRIGSYVGFGCGDGVKPCAGIAAGEGGSQGVGHEGGLRVTLKPGFDSGATVLKVCAMSAVHV